ncbi:G patch domain-containing protein 4 [Diachasma alloeum]|uniref:G patch domain-containing protein 4 n=1 Tax=Diachasma alloeum TaxID=454923 RepID=UPI0007383CCE|nr:G patch domain-containing protein 4 [Diachasma alloeum]
MSSFAKNQLLKYGWTEGKGLGKNENGIVDALKPKLKFGTTGIGHDGAEYNWWEHVYNEASANLEVKSDSTKVNLTINKEDAVTIATSKWNLTSSMIKKNNNLHFGNFIKTSTLHDGENTEDEEYSSNKIHMTEKSEMLSVLTDEELFKACGGRTAHKGARHGIKLSGKLARIERQEQELLAKQNQPSTSFDWVTVEVKRKKKRKHEKMDYEVLGRDNEGNLAITLEAEESPRDSISEDLSDSPKLISKKSRLKDKRKLEDLTHKMLISLDLSEDSGMPEGKKRRKKHKKCEREAEEPDRKRKKKISPEEETADDNNIPHPLVGDFGIVVEDPGCNDDGFVSGDDLTLPPEKTSKEAKRLNQKIQKRKRKKMARLQKIKLEKLSESLKSLDLTSSTVVTNTEKIKKKKMKTKT